MPIARVRSIALEPQDPPQESGEARIKVQLEDGKGSTFAAATFDRPGKWLEGRNFHFGDSVLFSRALDQETLGRAVVEMAEEMSGFWLRYYNSSVAEPANPGAGASATVTKPSSPDLRHGSAVVEVLLKDGRIFSILAATPSWFEEKTRELDLSFYFGPAVLFLKEMTPAVAGKAAEAMAAAGAECLCRYDTPRKTLSEVLAEFKTRHP
jgi:hypothetical protein